MDPRFCREDVGAFFPTMAGDLLVGMEVQAELLVDLAPGHYYVLFPNPEDLCKPAVFYFDQLPGGAL